MATPDLIASKMSAATDTVGNSAPGAGDVNWYIIHAF